MAFNFPDTPTIGQVFQWYTWDGEKWIQTFGGIATTTFPPANTILPVIGGLPNVGVTLATTNGGWTGTPAPTFTYQWKRDGVAIPGATANIYSLVTDDLGAMITVTVTATNLYGGVSATAAGVGPVLTPIAYVRMLSASRAGVDSVLTSDSGSTMIVSNIGAVT